MKLLQMGGQTHLRMINLNCVFFFGNGKREQQEPQGENPPVVRKNIQMSLRMQIQKVLSEKQMGW